MSLTKEEKKIFRSRSKAQTRELKQIFNSWFRVNPCSTKKQFMAYIELESNFPLDLFDHYMKNGFDKLNIIGG